MVFAEPKIPIYFILQIYTLIVYIVDHWGFSLVFQNFEVNFSTSEFHFYPQIMHLCY
jgi:hypothetical protein